MALESGLRRLSWRAWLPQDECCSGVQCRVTSLTCHPDFDYELTLGARLHIVSVIRSNRQLKEPDEQVFRT